MNSFGLKLRSERLRLGMTQEEFATVGGVKKGAQINYEQDKRYPDGAYLKAVAAIGVDVSFVVTDRISTEALTIEESELVNGYRALDTRGKAGVLALIDGMKPTEIKPSIKFAGTVQQVVEGDQTVKGTIIFGSAKTSKKKQD